jgi:hypothetical protein
MTPWVTYGEPMRYPRFSRASAPDSSSATPIVVSCPMSALMSARRFEKCPCYGPSPLSTADIGAGLSDVARLGRDVTAYGIIAAL